MIRKSFMMLLTAFFITLMSLSVIAQEANADEAIDELKAQPDNTQSNDALKIVYGGQANAVVIIAGNADH